jgi:uncharacterized repeat protein (TIGR03803 family)
LRASRGIIGCLLQNAGHQEIFMPIVSLSVHIRKGILLLILSLGALVGNAAAQYAIVHSFSGQLGDGRQPQGGVIAVGSTLYSTTSNGGDDDQGTIYKVNADGTGYSVLHSFAAFPSGDGNVPLGDLTLVGSTLYGVTESGGALGTGSIGTVFKINTDGSDYSVLHSFNNAATDGNNPVAGLTAVGSKLYGSTDNGGSGGGGTIFELNTDGTGFSVIHSFTEGANDGAVPYAGMTLVGSTLYGTTDSGGALANGTVFKINTDGTGFGLLHSFAGAFVDGANPTSQLELIGSTLYGTTSGGGGNQLGVVFQVNTDGTGYGLLHTFAGGVADGAHPLVGVTAVGTALYGTTEQFGPNGGGTLFTLNADGTAYSTVHSFGANDGSQPGGKLTLLNATLYGTTIAGGINVQLNNDGTLFAQAVPEPAALILACSGVVCALLSRRYLDRRAG